MKSLILVTTFLMHNLALARSICTYIPESGDDLPFEEAYKELEEEGGPGLTQLEKLEVNGVLFQLITGEGIDELRISKEGNDISSTTWKAKPDQEIGHYFSGVSISCDYSAVDNEEITDVE